MSLESALPVAFGGLTTTLVANYLGISNPIISILGASVGAACISNAKKFYDENKEVLPGADGISKLTDSLYGTVGLKYFTIIVKNSEQVVFNRLEKYIMYMHGKNLISTVISHTDNTRVDLTLESSAFSQPIIDHYNGHRIYILLRKSEIHIRSCTLNIEQLKGYIQVILSSRIGVRTLTVHQCVIENFNFEEENQKKSSKIIWSSFCIQTNKNFSNTILSESVQKNLVDDLYEFVQNEDYYNTKGIPYKRGYLLYGVPGTGKTSIIKSIASQYGMDIYLVNMGDVTTEKELLSIFQGMRNNNGYHIVCFEDIDRCAFLYDKYHRNNNLVRTFLNELDGVIETPKRITILTVNDKSVIENTPALCRPGRLDKQVELGYCDADQVCRLYNHYTDSGQKLELKSLEGEMVTPAQVVKHILSDPKMSPEDFVRNFKTVSKIEINEKNFSRRNIRRPRTPVDRQKRIVIRRKQKYRKLLLIEKNLPRKIAKSKQAVETSEFVLEKRKATALKRKNAKRRKI